MTFLKHAALTTATCLTFVALPAYASTVTEATGTANGDGTVFNDVNGDLNVTLTDATFVFEIFAADPTRARRITSITTVYAVIAGILIPVVSDTDDLGVFTGQDLRASFTAIKSDIQASPAIGTVDFFGTDVSYTDFEFTTDTADLIEAKGSISYINADRSTPFAASGAMQINVAFVSAVPLPASLPLALGGTALLGAVARKRKDARA